MKFKNLFVPIFLASIFLPLSSCVPPEEIFHEAYSIENNAIISIENNQNTFHIDDTIIIETVIENSQTTTNNQSINLTDSFYADTPESIRLYNTLYLFKESNFGRPVSVHIKNEYLEVMDGEAETNANPGINIVNIYNGTVFKSKFGIQLKEKGTYYLSGSYIIKQKSYTQFTGGVYQLGTIEINSTIINADATGLYKFTVN